MLTLLSPVFSFLLQNQKSTRLPVPTVVAAQTRQHVAQQTLENMIVVQCSYLLTKQSVMLSVVMDQHVLMAVPAVNWHLVAMAAVLTQRQSVALTRNTVVQTVTNAMWKPTNVNRVLC